MAYHGLLAHTGGSGNEPFEGWFQRRKDGLHTKPSVWLISRCPAMYLLTKASRSMPANSPAQEPRYTPSERERGSKLRRLSGTACSNLKALSCGSFHLTHCFDIRSTTRLGLNRRDDSLRGHGLYAS